MPRTLNSTPTAPPQTPAATRMSGKLKAPDIYDGMSVPDAALAWAEAGFHVFPCQASDHDPDKQKWAKKPHPMLRKIETARGEGGWKLATTDLKAVKAWWEEDPTALIGIAPGRSGAVVLDADGNAGVKALYEAAAGELDLETTFTTRTPGRGGGLHIWFDRREADTLIGNGSLQGIPGEARGDRGYVIAPPSKLPDGGEYTVKSHTNDLARLPEWAAWVLPWESKTSPRASIAEITTGDEQEWLTHRSAVRNDPEADQAIATAVRSITNATAGDQDEGRHPTATRAVASILSRAQRGEINVDLYDAIGRIREALIAVKPKGGPDFDRFVSDAIAIRVSEDRAKAASHIDTSTLRVATNEETEALETAREERITGIDLTSEWGAPLPLVPQRATPDPFPTERLPEVMQQTVREVAKATQMSETLPALAALGTVSAATAGGIILSLNQAWTEGLSLYLIGVADPSERKTAALKPFTDALRLATLKWTEGTAAERARWEADEASLELRLKEARKSAADPAGQAALAKLILEQEQLHAQGQGLVIPNRLMHVDPTQEALVQAMVEMHGVGYLASSEGAFIANLAGRYTNTARADLSLVNEAWSRSFIRSTRVGRGDTVVEVPHLTIVSFVQPSIAAQLAHPDFEATGFLSRVLYAAPASHVGQRVASLSSFSPLYTVAMDRFTSMLEGVFYRGWTKENNPHVLMLDADARSTFEEWWHYCEVQSPRDAWWGKAHGQTLRLATVMQLADDQLATRVSGRWVDAAIALIEFFAAEQARMREDVILGETNIIDTRLHERLLNAVARRWGTEAIEQFTLRDVQRWLTVSRPEAELAAEGLVERGWLRSDRGTRTDSYTYIPHPQLPTCLSDTRSDTRGKNSDTSDTRDLDSDTVRDFGASVRPVSDSKNADSPNKQGKSASSVRVSDTPYEGYFSPTDRQIDREIGHPPLPPSDTLTLAEKSEGAKPGAPDIDPVGALRAALEEIADSDEVRRFAGKYIEEGD